MLQHHILFGHLLCNSFLDQSSNTNLVTKDKSLILSGPYISSDLIR
jgi:hypothetical protein